MSDKRPRYGIEATEKNSGEVKVFWWHDENARDRNFDRYFRHPAFTRVAKLNR